MKKYVLIIIFISILPLSLFADTNRDLLKKGNSLYQEKKYNDAEINYRKASEGADNTKAQFNLGDALYKEGNYKEAADKFAGIATNSKLDDKVRAKALHNLGNSYLKSKMFDKSVDAYKNSLRLNPDDGDTRYNLEYAKRMLQVQQQQNKQNQQNQNNKDQKNQNGQNQDQNKQNDQQNKDNKQQNQNDQQNKDKKDGQNQNSQNNDNKDGKGKESKDQSGQDNGDNKDKVGKEGDDGKPIKGKISRQDAERILNALSNQEKEVQKKVRKQKGSPTKTEKNW